MSSDAALRDDAEKNNFFRLHIMGDDGGADMVDACQKLFDALEMRDKYHPSDIIPGAPPRRSGLRERVTFASQTSSQYSQASLASGATSSKESLGSHPGLVEQFKMVDGVVLFAGQKSKPVSYNQHASDFKALQRIVEDGPCRSTCRSRLKILEWQYIMYNILNSPLEERWCSLNRGGGIYTTYKVDNSVRLSTAAGARELLNFIIDKAVNHGDDVVNTVDRKEETLQAFLAKRKIHNPRDLSVESMGLQPDANEHFHRFDIFSKKFSRGGEVSVELLHLFLKRDGKELKGRYYGELCQKVFQRDTRKRPYIATEYKVPIFGMNSSEWVELARWIRTHNLKNPNNRWVIQIPRIAEIRGIYKCADQQQQLDNIFLPLWEASAHPSSWPELADFLASVVGFSVISEERSRGQDLPPERPPKQWPWKENPSDIYFNYYIWANVYSLNQFRSERGLSTFAIRPTCGEMGDMTHLISAFLLADSINHGIRMANSPVLQYLFYMKQIGIVSSPLANNGLFLQYTENPFPLFLKRGLRVSLSTDDPLHFHYTNEPLIEEYGTAAKVLKLSVADLCETARNSVLISGFDYSVKQKWLGQDYAMGSDGNSFQHSHVPTIRLVFREEVRSKERNLLLRAIRHKQGTKPSAGAGAGAGAGAAEPRPPCSPMQVFEEAGRKPPEMSEDQRHENFEKNVKFHRLGIFGPPEFDRAKESAAALIQRALALRARYQQHQPAWHPSTMGGRAFSISTVPDVEIRMHRGVVALYDRNTGENAMGMPFFPTVSEYARDLTSIHDVWEDVSVKSLSYTQLQLLQAKFGLHIALNSQIEEASGENEHRDFYQSYKVDTYVHMQSGMTAKQLLQFFYEKASKNGEDVVMVMNEQPVSLSALLEKTEIDPKTVDIRLLTSPGAPKAIEAADDFSQKYSSDIDSELCSLLLSSHNSMSGRYFAELIKQAFAQLEGNDYTFAEYGLVIRGHSREDWNELAKWQNIHGVASTNNKFRVQIPRLYSAARAKLKVQHFGELLHNVFLPLWEVSKEPSRNPILDHFLSHLSGFDMVANESVMEPPFFDGDPERWDGPDNPSFATWMYYMWINITTLNHFRDQCGKNTFSFRVHCGGGPLKNLAIAFLCAESVVNGMNLSKDPALQYLYYLGQIPLSMSPISTQSDAGYLSHPFPDLFKRGLPISLSSHFPLQFHHTQEPLVEEYSIASKLWKFSPTDLCEMARCSVLQSGFNHPTKRKWLGDAYFLHSSAGNDPTLSHIPNVRVAYRFETYHSECQYLEQSLPPALRAEGLHRSMFTIEEEDATAKELGLHADATRVKRARNQEDAQSVGSHDTTIHRPSRSKEEVLEQRIRDLEQQIEKLNAKEHSSSTAHTTNINKLMLINTGDSITNQFLGTATNSSTNIRTQAPPPRSPSVVGALEDKEPEHPEEFTHHHQPSLDEAHPEPVNDARATTIPAGSLCCCMM
eukprot:GGOE01004003.1.p1 GENE.GGOE01004003.1~~GGOE01004003.1.p1  ORF type:complete len:1457 (-),score=434.93 GGOE01004003.1:196-4566(-)